MESVKIHAKMGAEKMQTAKSSDIELFVLVKKTLLEIHTRDATLEMTMMKMKTIPVKTRKWMEEKIRTTVGMTMKVMVGEVAMKTMMMKLDTILAILMMI